MQTYTHKQLELINLWRSSGLRRINILQGSVRSGKTWISLVLWGLWVWSMPPDRCFLMTAKTITSLKRNCLDLLQQLVGINNFTYSIPRKEAWLFGRRIWLEGANDARSESKIRGMTLAGAYVDELTQIPQDFFTMLLSRLSEQGAKLIATTNPDSPTHWVKTDYIDREDALDLLTMKFLITDNDFLDPSYVENLKKEYTGAFYSRFVLGEWIRPSGLIYPQFSPANIDENGHCFTSKQFEEAAFGTVGRAYRRQRGEWVIAVDYGTSNPTCALFARVFKGVAWIVREYYWNGRKQGQRTDEEHMTAIMDIAKELDCYPAAQVIIDPSAASFITCFRRLSGMTVQSANNSVIDGIRDTASAFVNRKVLVHEGCQKLIEELQSYVWDESADEAPVKENNHAVDAARYLVRTYLRRYYHDFVDTNYELHKNLF